MIVFGVLLMLLGSVFGAPMLWTLGMVLTLAGAVLWILGAAGHAAAGRAHYWR